jgi:hypothetical protein
MIHVSASKYLVSARFRISSSPGMLLPSLFPYQTPFDLEFGSFPNPLSANHAIALIIGLHSRRDIPLLQYITSTVSTTDPHPFPRHSVQSETFSTTLIENSISESFRTQLRPQSQGSHHGAGSRGNSDRGHRRGFKPQDHAQSHPQQRPGLYPRSYNR